MNVFKIYRDYQSVGINFGVPAFIVEFGLGLKLDPIEIAQRLGTMGVRRNSWVVLRNNPVSEKGCGTLVEGLKKVGLKVEIESNGKYGCPNWFHHADRWIVFYSSSTSFNYGALRPRQDLLLYEGKDPGGFLTSTSNFDCLKGLIADPKEVWELVRDLEVRVYPNRSMVSAK